MTKHALTFRLVRRPLFVASLIATTLLLSNGGTKAEVLSLTCGSGCSPPWQVVGVGDFNGDGYADVLWFDASSGVLGAWLLDGQGNVMAPQFLSLTCGTGCFPEWRVVGVGDFNGDGFADVLWFDASSGVLGAWLLDGQGNVMAPQFLSLTCGSGCSPPWQIVGVGDFNGDGHADVLWFDASTGVLGAWLLDGQGTVMAPQFLSLTCGSGCFPTWQVVGVGDFNGDGHADVLWFNASSGVLGAWLLDGQGHIMAPQFLSLTCGAGCSPPWQVLGVGDFNGDGHVDVLWFNASSGALGAWLLDGQGNVTAMPFLSWTCGPGCSSSWQVVGVGDFNGDRYADVLWFNASSGALGEWLLDGQGNVMAMPFLSLT